MKAIIQGKMLRLTVWWQTRTYPARVALRFLALALLAGAVHTLT